MQLEWNYGSNERISDWDKVEIIREMQRVASIPYEQRAEIIAPLLNKIMEVKIKPKDLIEAHKNEIGNIRVEYGEL